MSDETKSLIPAEVTTSLKGSIESAEKYFAAIVANSEKCVMVLSKFETSFATDQQDAEAAAILGQVKPAFEKIQERRKEISSPLDNLKQKLMEPEKKIQVAIDRVTALRNEWARKVAEKEAADKAKIKAEQDKKLEKVSIVTQIRKNVELRLLNAYNSADIKLMEFFGKITLENFDEACKIIQNPPELLEATYDGLFIPAAWEPAIKYHSTDEVKVIANEVKASYPFETVRADYAAKMMEKKQPWINKLPAKKTELQELANLAAQDVQKAEELREQKRKADEAAIEKQKADAKNAAETKAAEIEKEGDTAALGVQFSGQIAEQTVGTQTGVRKVKRGVLACDEKDTMVVIGELMLSCLSHPKNEGIYKKDKKSGQIIMDGDTPVYADWLNDWLNFYAQNCKPTISGIKIVEQVSAITPRKK